MGHPIARDCIIQMRWELWIMRFQEGETRQAFNKSGMGRYCSALWTSSSMRAKWRNASMWWCWSDEASFKSMISSCGSVFRGWAVKVRRRKYSAEGGIFAWKFKHLIAHSKKNAKEHQTTTTITMSSRFAPSSIMAPTVVPYSGTACVNPFDTKESTPNLTQVTYLCGQCSKENTIKAKDVIRCRHCGYRIVYKKRTARSMFMSANFKFSLISVLTRSY